MRKVVLVFVFGLTIGLFIVAGLFGVIPVISPLMGTNKPRDLRVKYTNADLQSIHIKSQVKYTTLPDNTDPTKTRQFSGKQEVTTDFTSEEITAAVNNQPWKYWPYKDVQIRFNVDGSAEASGVIIKDRLSGYATAIGVPAEAANFAVKYLPDNSVFYVKGKAALSNNSVSVFEPQKFEIGRIPLPVSAFLAWGGLDLVPVIYAQENTSMTGELAKVNNKKALIIMYINSRLSSAFGDFYARKAFFKDNAVSFEGVLSKEISYSP